MDHTTHRPPTYHQGALRSHLIGFSAKTGAVVANVSSLPLRPSSSGFVGAGQCVAVDERRDAAFLVGRDGGGVARLWRTDLNLSADSGNGDNVTVEVAALAGVAAGIDFLLRGCALDPGAGVLWVTLPMGRDATSYTTSLVGVDTGTGRVLHRLDHVNTPTSGPAAVAFDARRGKVVGLSISMDFTTHAMNGSEFFEIGGAAGAAHLTTLRTGVLPASVVEVLGGVAAVDSANRIFYFECIVAANTTAAAAAGPPLAGRAGRVREAAVSGTATRRGLDGARPTHVPVGPRARAAARGAGTELTGLCALDATSGAFKFARGVCADMSACPWNLQFWNV